MQGMTLELSLLSAMITPAVLISACGTLLVSTAIRLGRVVDRVRELNRLLEQVCADPATALTEERSTELERQLALHAQRGRLIQGSLTSFYIALGLFVATTVSVGLGALVREVAWLPNVLGVVGTIVLFYGCMLLIAETRLAWRSVKDEMQFVLRVNERRRVGAVSAPAANNAAESAKSKEN